jgi:hypothetical protein
MKDFKEPKTVKEVRQFLGMTGYYRKHIRGYSKIAAPLTEQTKGKQKLIEWTPECKVAFNKLKEALTTAPVLAYPNFKEPFILTTDASNYATGAILSQIKEGKEVVIAYGGRKFQEAERKYTTTERECLAVLIGLREFEPYLRVQEVFRFLKFSTKPN